MINKNEFRTLHDGLCIIEQPENNNAQSVIFIHGFASDKDEVGGSFQKIRGKLLKEGTSCISIELPGFNDNMKNISNIDFKSLVESVKDAYSKLQSKNLTNFSNTRICAFSMGSSLAALTLKCLPTEPSGMVFISPTLHLQNDFKSVLGNDLVNRALQSADATTIKVDFFTKGCHPMKVEFFKQLSDFDVLEALQEFSGSLYIIAGKDDFSFNNLNIIRKSISNNPVVTKVINGADHIFNAFDPEISSIPLVVEKSANWLSLNLDILSFLKEEDS